MLVCTFLRCEQNFNSVSCAKLLDYDTEFDKSNLGLGSKGLVHVNYDMCKSTHSSKLLSYKTMLRNVWNALFPNVVACTYHLKKMYIYCFIAFTFNLYSKGYSQLFFFWTLYMCSLKNSTFRDLLSVQASQYLHIIFEGHACANLH